MERFSPLRRKKGGDRLTPLLLAYLLIFSPKPNWRFSSLSIQVIRGVTREATAKWTAEEAGRRRRARRPRSSSFPAPRRWGTRCGGRWGSRRRWWRAACFSTACRWSPSCSPATSVSSPSPAPPSPPPSPTSPASASCWEWEARWIHFVDNHMGQNNMICSGHMRKELSLFLRLRVFLWPLFWPSLCLTKFLQAQNIVHPLVVCSGVTLILHILLCWLLVQNFGLGNKGAALATSVSYWSNVLLLAIYIKVSEAGRRSWHGWSRGALKLKDVNMYLRLAIPSTFMTCLEYWAFEMVVLLAGFLPNPKLETSILSISLNTMWMVYTIPSGLSSAISIRVSNELGAGNPQVARLSVFISAIMCLTEGLLVAVITVLVRDIWGYLYSNEEEVVKYVSTMMPILATSDFMDGIQCTLSGAARGCGWQKVCSVINLCAYYAIGIPSAVIFAFVLKIGGKGLWLGIICAMAVQILALVVMMLRTSWDKEAEKARARTRVQESDGSIISA